MSENEPSAAKVSSEDDDDNKNQTLNRTADTSCEMDTLEERFSQQQEMISQLKVMVLAEETARTEKNANTRLKMEKYVLQLAKIQERAKKKQKLTPSTPKDNTEQSTTTVDESKSTDSSSKPLTTDDRASEAESTSQSNIISPKPSDIASEKPKLPNREVTKLLYQQIKERKAMIAERTKTEKEFEKALMNIQKQLDESQSQSADIVQVGQSKVTLNIPSHLNVDTNKTILELRNKISQMEGNILDLQETCKEKDSVIRSKTEAITLMSADLSKKGKNTLDLLDDTKEQMQKMQENFANMESKMKSEKDALISELEVYKNKITYLEEANSILETERFKLSIENTGLEEKIAEKENEITNINCMLQDKIKELNEFSSKLDDVPKIDETEEKGAIEAAEMNQLTEKIEILERLNNTLRQSNIELQEKLTLNVDEKSNQSFVEPQVKSSPKSKSKFNKNAAKNVQRGKSFEDEKKNYLDSIKKLESVIETLNKQVLEKEVEIHKLKEAVKTSEAIVESTQHLTVDDSTHSVKIEERAIEVSVDDIVGDVQDPDNVSLKDQLEDALKQIESLSKDLSESNKSMIKLKATHKTKVKQMQKSIDDYSKVSHSNAEVVRLQSDVNTLTQKVAELEDDKGNLQLHLVDYDSGRVSDSQLHAKLVDVESVAEERLKAIADLEMQKFDLVQELHLVKQKVTELEDKMSDLTFLENEHVSSEIKYAQLEEQLDVLRSDKSNLLKQIENITAERNSLLLNVESLNKEKSEATNKLDYYVQENMELIDRLDKLSAEKVSSAESIEMVESLTSQEKLEIEQFQKSYSVQQHEKDAEETKEDVFSKDDADKVNLLNKIDLYSQERDKVIDKLESLQAAHNEISLRLEELTNEKKLLEGQYDVVKKEKDDVCVELKTNEEKIVQLGNKIEELSNENSTLSEKLSQLSTPVRTEEVIVSETIEVENTIEKEFIEYPIKPEVSEEIVEAKPIEMVEETSKPPISLKKGDKKFTKEILRLKNTLKHKENEISDMNTKLSELSEIIKSSEELNLQLNEKLLELKDINSSLNNQVIQFNVDKENYNVSKNFEQLNSDLLKTNDSLTESVSTLESKVQSFNEQIENRDVEILKLRDQVAKKDEKYSLQNAKVITELETKTAYMQSVIDHNNGCVANVCSELYEYFDAADRCHYLMGILQSKIDSLIKIINEKIIEIAVISDEKTTIVDNMSILVQESLEKDEIIAGIKQQLVESSKNFVDHSQSLSAYESEMLQLKEKCSTYEDNANKMTQDYVSLEETCKSQCIKLDGVEASLKSKSDVCDKMKAVVEKLKNKLKSEIQKCKDFEDNMNTLKSQYSELEIQLNCAEEELKQSHRYKEAAVQLDVAINELSATNEKLAHVIQSSKDDNENLTSQNEELRVKLSDCELRMQREKESYLENINVMKDELKSNKSALLKIAELEEQLVAKQEEVKILLKQLEDVGNTYSETTSAHEAKIQEREVYIESLEIDLAKCKEKIARLEENSLMMESLEKKTNSLVTKLQEKDLAFSETLQHEDELNKKLVSLTAQDKLIQKQLHEIKHENNELHENISSLNDAKKHMQTELDASRSELSHLKSDLVDFEALNQDRYAAIERCNALEADLKKASHEYSEELKMKSRECEYFETTLQTQCENYEQQLKQSKENCKLLQEDIASHLKTIREVVEENERLKCDAENFNSNTSAYSPPLFKFDDSNFQQNQSVINQDVFNLQLELGNLSSALREKDGFIAQLENEIVNLKSVRQPMLNEEVFTKAAQAVSMETPNFFDQLSVDKAPMFNLQSLEDQIISNDTVKVQNVSNVDTSMIRGFCHDPPVAVVQAISTQTANTSSFVDEIIEPKIAFKCFTAEEVIPVDDKLQSHKILELETSLAMLKEEKDKLATDLAQSQLKTNKALLKLKEYKLRYDNLNVELKKLKSSSVTSDLDSAIQDELYSQIAKLEERLKEVSSTTDKDKLEKDNLQKRIDVLTSANERLIEMKEKQDLEMGVFKAKNQSLNEKVKNLQWGEDFDVEDEKSPEEDTVKSDSYLKTIDELNIKVKDLECENCELQAALNEQENKFELMIQNERKQMSVSSSDLKKSLEDALEDKINLQNELANSTIQNNIQLENFNTETVDLKSKLQALLDEKTELRDNYRASLSEKDKQVKDFNLILSTNISLEKEFDSVTRELTKSRKELSNCLDEKNELVKNYDVLSKNLEQLSQERQHLESSLQLSVSNGSEIHTELIEVRKVLVDCENSKSELEQRVRELEALLSSKNQSDNYSETSHEMCTRNINDVKQRLEDIKNESEEYKTSTESQLSTQIQNHNILLQQYDDLKSILAEKEMEIVAINEKLYELNQPQEQSELQNMMQLKEKEIRELEVSYNYKLGEYGSYCQARDLDLTESQEQVRSLQSKLEDYDELVRQVSDFETKLNDAVHEKEAELSNLRLKMHAERTQLESTVLELTNKASYLENQLEVKVQECRGLNAKLVELQTLVDEEATQMGEMRTALENQEIEIVTLKENLQVHAEAYDKLNKAYTKSERHVTFSDDTKFNEDSTPKSAVSKDDQISPRADLDLAMYMLHQRDVRCEELTVELMSLLEERDTLQLKLSNAIRTNEEMRTKPQTQDPQIEESFARSVAPQTSSAPDGASERFDGADLNAAVATGQEMYETDGKELPSTSLQNKISELHSVSHFRDIRVKDERESRQRQMDLLQRDIQNLPPEAAAQLREAHYTLSRDTQSASTVLFNWLWGRTTPKVVHM